MVVGEGKCICWQDYFTEGRTLNVFDLYHSLKAHLPQYFGLGNETVEGGRLQSVYPAEGRNGFAKLTLSRPGFPQGIPDRGKSSFLMHLCYEASHPIGPLIASANMRVLLESAAKKGIDVEQLTPVFT